MANAFTNRSKLNINGIIKLKIELHTMNFLSFANPPEVDYIHQCHRTPTAKKLCKKLRK